MCSVGNYSQFLQQVRMSRLGGTHTETYGRLRAKTEKQYQAESTVRICSPWHRSKPSATVQRPRENRGRAYDERL